MSEIKNGREKLFCALYCCLGDAAQAARQAGWPREDALRQGMLLLGREEIQREIDRVAKLRSDPERVRRLVIAGLLRLAFGSGREAMGQFLSGEEPQEESGDWFGVKAVRQLKGGGAELEWADRAQALETLWRLCSPEKEEAGSGFYEAIRRSVTGEDG